MISVEFHNTVDDSLLKFAVILSRYRGRWLLCQHRERNTCEYSGGRREAGETVEHTTHRELYEETGTTCFTLTPSSVYSVRETLEDTNIPVINYGVFYYGNITELRPMPEEHEVARIALFREPPDNWTYSNIQPILLEYLRTRLLESG